MKSLRSIFIAAIFFATHLALVTYINSSLLAQYTQTALIGVFYTAGACVSLFVLWILPRILQRYGARKTLLTLCGNSIVMLLALATTHTGFIALPAFVLYLAGNASIAYCFDIFIEHYSPEKSIGTIRGSYLSLTNTAWVLMPTVTAIILQYHSFNLIYSIAACAVGGTIMMVLFGMRTFTDTQYNTALSFPFKALLTNSILRRIASLNFILQLFYVWMVIYSPLYLMRVVGLSWQQLGVIFSCMLIAFVIIQYPAGKLSDRLGQKNGITLALLICAGSVLAFSQVQQGTPIIAIIAILFISRIGAGLLEVLSDTYFFKHVTEAQASIVSSYRMIVPLSFIVGASFGGLIVFVGGFSAIFISLSVLLVCAAIYSRRLV